MAGLQLIVVTALLCDTARPSTSPGTGAPVPAQTPPSQTSSSVQLFASSHTVPSGSSGFEQSPVAPLQVPDAWQSSLAVQTTGFAPVQTPAPQVSVCVHASESSQAVPSGSWGFEQRPVAPLQVPGAWHESLGVHTTGFAPVQTPVAQVSVCVQALKSLQAVPFGFCGFEQMPVAGLQLPASWQESLAAQATGFEPVHTPDWQESVCVHASPSTHGAPFAAPAQR